MRHTYHQVMSHIKGQSRVILVTLPKDFRAYLILKFENFVGNSGSTGEKQPLEPVVTKTVDNVFIISYHYLPAQYTTYIS